MQSEPKWRTITAEQFRVGGDASGDFDEAFVRDLDGWRREIWDVGCEHDDGGNVVIYTSAAEPLIVPQDHPVRVR